MNEYQNKPCVVNLNGHNLDVYYDTTASKESGAYDSYGLIVAHQNTSNYTSIAWIYVVIILTHAVVMMADHDCARNNCITNSFNYSSMWINC